MAYKNEVLVVCPKKYLAIILVQAMENTHMLDVCYICPF
jgi:hypothetical protein